MRQYDRAIQSELGCLRRQPKSFFAHLILGWAYEQKRMYPEALAELRESARLTNNAPLLLAAYGQAMAASGDRRGATEMLARLQQLAEARYVSAYDFAMLYAGLGEKDRAFTWLDRARQERSSFLPYITWDRRADTLRADPRFHELLQQLGLAQTAGAAAHISQSAAR